MTRRKGIKEETIKTGTRITTAIKPILAVWVLVFMLSCRKVSFEEMKSVENQKWMAKDTLVFNVPVQDTLYPHDVLITLRHSGAYPYSNIYFFVQFKAPNGAELADTIIYQLADNQGQWKGKGWGSLWSHQLPLRQNILFPYKGIYSFMLVHGMRENPLPGIVDVGIMVKESEDE